MSRDVAIRYILVILSWAVTAGVAMTASQAGMRGAAPMAGPDFVFGAIASYTSAPGSDGILLLQDGAIWHVRATDGDHDANSRLIELARHHGLIFISGDRHAGTIDRVAVPRALAAHSVGPMDAGRTEVTFFGPPSVYYVANDRPWAQAALALLHRSIAARLPPSRPDLLVSIDTVSNEVMDVRPAAGR